MSLCRPIDVRPPSPGAVSGLRLVLCAMLGGGWVSAHGQVLRIGGFDFNSKARVEGVYSSNVNRERPGETSEPPEDYYFVVGLDLNSTRQMGRATVIDISTGIAEERHFVREDLNNSENPFGRFALNSATDIGRLTFDAGLKFEKTAESQTDRFAPGGRARARDPRDIFQWYAGVRNNHARRLTWRARHDVNTEQHDLEKFQLDNREETGDTFMLDYDLTRRLRPGYAFNQLDSVYENNPENNRTRVKHEFLFPFLLLDKPNLTYSFIWQRDDRDDGTAVEWMPRNVLQLFDSRQLSPALSFTYYARYDDEQRPEKDDIRFQYGASLTHEISRSASHTISVDRQPVETLGTTLESDITQYRYQFTKSDLFIHNLDFSLYGEYQIAVPESDEANEEETTKRYGLTLSHIKNITPRFARRVKYLYSFEESNIQPGVLEEHRVTLGYDYFF